VAKHLLGKMHLFTLAVLYALIHVDNAENLQELCKDASTKTECIERVKSDNALSLVQKTQWEGKVSMSEEDMEVTESMPKPEIPLNEGDYNLTKEELAGEKEACSLGDEEDCKILEETKQFFKKYEDDVGDELGAMRKETGGKVPQDLIQLHKGNLSTSDDLEEQIGLKLHVGPISIDGDGVSVKPQMMFGAESDHFNFVGGCGDVRESLKCEATMEVRGICTASGNGIVRFLDSVDCKGEDLLPTDSAAKAGSEILSLLAQKVGVDASGDVWVDGKATMAQGVSLMGGVALGLWEDSEGFRMVGGGTAGFKKEIGFEFYVGIHHSGHQAKFKLAGMGVTIEGKIDCQYRKTNPTKANKVAGSTPVTTGPAQKFQPVGYGYGRGPNGARTASRCKMHVSFTDCLLECDGDSACNGFDAEQDYDWTWQQCCIRTDGYRTKPGWHSSGGSGKVTEGTWRNHNRLVMAKNQFLRIGYGYGRGAGGARTHTYCKMHESFDACENQCKNDPMCTGFDVERNWNWRWQQCCIRSLSFKNTPGGWHRSSAASIPVVQATSSSPHNREVWAKAPLR